jgi:hypothetical protein
MREDEIVAQLIDEIDAITPINVGVRTSGGDQNVSPPEVILNWNTDRLPAGNGHSPFGGYVYDDSGNKVGIEYHTYWRFEADIQLRYYSEGARDSNMDTIQMHFVPYEANAEDFAKDTRAWEVGATGPRSQPVREPDWYSVGVLVTFEFLKREEVTGQTRLQEINTDVEIDETLQNTSSQTK